MDKQAFINEIASRGVIKVSVISTISGYDKWFVVFGTLSYVSSGADENTVYIKNVDARNPPTEVEDILFTDSTGVVDELPDAWLLARIDDLPFTLACDQPTPNYPSGCKLLLAYDVNGEGLISQSEMGHAYADLKDGLITEVEFDFVSDAYLDGAINKVPTCSKCYITAYTFALVKGEQYISMPVIPEDATPETVFGADVEVWAWDDTSQNWIHPSVLEAGKGYLIRCPDARSITITGVAVYVEKSELLDIFAALSSGDYALVGSGCENISVVGTDLEGHIQKYNTNTGKFEYTNELEKGIGYWMSKAIKKVVTFTSVPAGANVTVT